MRLVFRKYATMIELHWTRNTQKVKNRSLAAAGGAESAHFVAALGLKVLRELDLFPLQASVIRGPLPT